MRGATYFVTFCISRGGLNAEERRVVLDHICSGDPDYYELRAATVLDDHVHMILRPNSGFTLRRIMKGIKGVSARELNRMRHTRGTVWQDEYYDRILRDADEVREKVRYMLYNAVERGLARDPWEYDGWYYYGMADKNVCPTSMADKNVCPTSMADKNVCPTSMVDKRER